MKMILASNNAHKLREFHEILSPCGIEIVSQRDIGCFIEPEETGETFEENSYIKAEAIMRETGLAAVADDSGLVVDALDGAPGVHSARYTGKHEDTDADRRNLLFKNMENETMRSARFVSAISCVFPNGDTLSAYGTCEGSIAYEEKGENGFGYDCMFIPAGMDITMAEMTAEAKNEISHRGNALEIFVKKLRNYNDNK